MVAAQLPLNPFVPANTPFDFGMFLSSSINLSKGATLVIPLAVNIVSNSTGAAPTITIADTSSIQKPANSGISNIGTKANRITVPPPAKSAGYKVAKNDGSGFLLNGTEKVTNTTPKKDTSGIFQLGPTDTAGAVVTLSSGSLVGGGGDLSAPAFLCSGTIDPGDPGLSGLVEFDGSWTAEASSVLYFDIYNSSASNDFDAVLMTSDATLGGSLSVNLNTYAPTPTDSYQIMSLPAGYTGTFASATLPTWTNAGSSYTFKVNYDATDVTLSVVAAPAAAPTITGISPSTGTTAGGQSVTITGTNFFGVSSVTFGSAPVSLFSVNSLGTQITLTTPPNPTGSATVTVTTVSGSATTSYSYTTGSVPGVTGVSPTFGYTVGGNSVIITGTNLTGATGGHHSGTTPASFYVFSATQINAIAPAVTATGLIDVRVSTYAGTSATNSGDQYTYNQQPAPTVSSLSTTTGPTAGSTSSSSPGPELPERFRGPLRQCSHHAVYGQFVHVHHRDHPASTGWYAACASLS